MEGKVVQQAVPTARCPTLCLKTLVPLAGIRVLNRDNRKEEVTNGVFHYHACLN